MSESEGFILKAEQFNQEEWCEMFIRVSETCKDLRVENECLQKELKEKDKEIERLNNIINEFDKWLENINIGELDDFFIGVKLSELKKAWNDIKGSDKE